MEEARREAIRWCVEVAGQRIHGTTRQRPLEHFAHEEKKHLLFLPAQPWEMVTWQKAKVGRDSHATVAGSVYSVPYRYVGQTLQVRLSKTTVQFFRGEELVRTHLKAAPGERRTDPADLPPGKAAFYERNPQWCLGRAQALGPVVHQAVREILAVPTLYNLRQAQGILRLGERYGATRLNAAAERALAYGDPRYRTIKNILEDGLDRLPLAFAEAKDVPAFLHGQQEFALSGKEELP